MRMMLCLVLASALAPSASAQEEGNEVIKTSGRVITEILANPEVIPQDLLDKAKCVIVFPSGMKFADGFDSSYGRGVMSCRRGKDFRGSWSPPVLMALGGGNFGSQLGGQATDFVLLVMRDRGAESILTNQVKLGQDLSAAAGPWGRDAAASTDAAMRAEILSYSRSRGLFAGISLEGTTVRLDTKANHNLYGKDLNAKDLVFNGSAASPASGRQLLSTLNSKSPAPKEPPGTEGGTPGAKPPPPKKPPGTKGRDENGKPSKGALGVFPHSRGVFWVYENYRSSRQLQWSQAS